MPEPIRFDDPSAARAIEFVYRTPDVVAQRARFLEALDPRPGERILDVGVGPGLLAHDLSRVVGPEGAVVGVDRSPAMVEMSRSRCAEMPWAEFREADATELPLGTGRFDAVVSTQVYEYVPDLPRALAEAHRVLRPGGRIWILDTDWDTAVWHTGDRARMRRVLDAWEAHLHDPVLPRTLAPRLREAGFEVRRCEVIPLVNTSLHEHTYSHGIARMIRAFVADPARVGQAEADAWLAELRALGREDRYFFSVNRYLFGATRG